MESKLSYGKAIKGELEKLAGTIKWAEQQDVTRLAQFLFAENKQMPLVCISSGGSLSAQRIKDGGAVSNHSERVTLAECPFCKVCSSC